MDISPQQARTRDRMFEGWFKKAKTSNFYKNKAEQIGFASDNDPRDAENTGEPPYSQSFV